MYNGLRNVANLARVRDATLNLCFCCYRLHLNRIMSNTHRAKRAVHAKKLPLIFARWRKISPGRYRDKKLEFSPIIRRLKKDSLSGVEGRKSLIVGKGGEILLLAS